MSNKKIDEALGIKSIDEFLSDLNVDDQVKQLGEIDDKVKENVQKIDSQIQEYKENGISQVDVSDIGASLNEIKQLVDVSKDTIRHVYESITSSELVDSELVGSLSKLLEATHLAVSEYIGLYKDRMAFYDKVRLEQIKHQHRMMELERKFEQAKELKDAGGKVIDAQDNKGMAFSQEDIIKQLNENPD